MPRAPGVACTRGRDDRPQQTPIVGYPVRTRTPYLIRRGISTVETAVYLVVGLLLILAAVLTVVGTLAVSRHRNLPPAS